MPGGLETNRRAFFVCEDISHADADPLGLVGHASRQLSNGSSHKRSACYISAQNGFLDRRLGVGLRGTVSENSFTLYDLSVLRG